MLRLLGLGRGLRGLRGLRGIHQSCFRASEFVPEVVEDLLYRKGEKGDFRGGGRFRKELEEVPQEQRRLMSVLREHTEALNWQGALELWNTEIPKDAGEEWHVLSRAVLNCLCKAMRYDEAKEVFHSMANRDTVAYNQMLLMLARLRRFMEFDQLLSRMDKEGVARSSVTYCNIMTKCKENRDWQEAVRTLEEFKARASNDDEAANWSFVYLAAMSACAKGRQPDQVEKLMRELQEMDPGAVLPNHWNSWIVSCAPDGERANRVMQEMRDAGFTPSPVDFRSLMVCHRNFEEQRRIYETMRKEHPTAKLPEAWAVLLRNAVLNGEPHAVDWLRQEMQDHGIPMDSDRAQQVPPLRRALRMLEDWQQTERLGAAAAGSVAAAPAPPAGLPSGWQSTTDPNTGQPYYWRTEDPAGTVTWQRPS